MTLQKRYCANCRRIQWVDTDTEEVNENRSCCISAECRRLIRSGKPVRVHTGPLIDWIQVSSYIDLPYRSKLDYYLGSTPVSVASVAVRPGDFRVSVRTL